MLYKQYYTGWFLIDLDDASLFILEVFNLHNYEYKQKHKYLF